MNAMKTLLPFVLCLVMFGCAGGPIRVVGRALAPIQKGDLDTAAQKMLAETETKFAEKTTKLQAELVKAKTRKPVSLWPIYVIAGLAMVLGPVLGYLFKKFASGIILGLSGLASIMALQFMQTYVWAMWIPFGLVVAVGLWFGVGYVRGVMAQKALEAIVPAIETKGTPELKAEIEDGAKKNKAALMVRAAVSNAKKRIKP